MFVLVKINSDSLFKHGAALVCEEDVLLQVGEHFFLSNFVFFYTSDVRQGKIQLE